MGNMFNLSRVYQDVVSTAMTEKCLKED